MNFAKILNIKKILNSNQILEFQHYLKNSKYLYVSYTTQPNLYDGDKDPSEHFCKNEIQNNLKFLTRLDINKVFRARKIGEEKLEAPEYQFLTKDQLDKLLKESFQKVNKLLQMPPILPMRKPIDEILSKDEALLSHDHPDNAKFVFIDISYNVSDRDRLIVQREPNGILRKSDWDVRHRMNEIYLPKLGRELNTPRMFTEDDYFEDLLKRQEYIFILDRACMQFEPDDPLYQKITSLTYEHINNNKQFDVLRSTRHFGPFVFYLCWFKTIDNLLIDLIEHKYLSEANVLLRLFYSINEKKFDRLDQLIDDNSFELIDDYLNKYSNKKAELELVLKCMKELFVDNKKQNVN